jgi:WD40 repeat protein
MVYWVCTVLSWLRSYDYYSQWYCQWYSSYYSHYHSSTNATRSTHPSHANRHAHIPIQFWIHSRLPSISKHTDKHARVLLPGKHLVTILKLAGRVSHARRIHPGLVNLLQFNTPCICHDYVRILFNMSVQKKKELRNVPYEKIIGGKLSKSPVVFTPDNKYVMHYIIIRRFCFCATGSQIRMFTVSDFKLERVFSTIDQCGHTQQITKLLLNPFNHFQLYSTSMDGMVKLWDFMDGVLLKVLPTTICTNYIPVEMETWTSGT